MNIQANKLNQVSTNLTLLDMDYDDFIALISIQLDLLLGEY